MADGVIPLQSPAVVDQRMDAEQLTVGANTVVRERVQICGAAASEIAKVTNSTPGGTDYGVVVRVLGSISASAASAATAARSAVSDSATAVSLIAANAGRLGLVITNDSSARLFVGYGSTDPTTTDYSFVVLSGQTWEMTSAVFTGQLKGIWETDPNDGAARITELTA